MGSHTPNISRAQIFRGPRVTLVLRQLCPISTPGLPIQERMMHTSILLPVGLSDVGRRAPERGSNYSWVITTMHDIEHMHIGFVNDDAWH
jgi:hypothetical protein